MPFLLTYHFGFLGNCFTICQERCVFLLRLAAQWHNLRCASVRRTCFELLMCTTESLLRASTVLPLKSGCAGSHRGAEVLQALLLKMQVIIGPRDKEKFKASGI